MYEKSRLTNQLKIRTYARKCNENFPRALRARGVTYLVHALGSARLAAHAGDGRRRKAAAEGLVQQYVYGATLDIHSVMIASLLLAHPTSPSAMVERAV